MNEYFFQIYLFQTIIIVCQLKASVKFVKVQTSMVLNTPCRTSQSL
jgi:hypothetical protein